MRDRANSAEAGAHTVELACDALVIGSGVAGYCAAIQASRSGCETLLVEKDDVLGGNSGPNLGVGITGADRYAYYAAETGIIHEIQEEASYLDTFGLRNGAYTISRRFEAVVQSALEAAGVRVLKRHYAREPVMDGARIAEVIVEDMAAFRTVRIRVRHVVIEASGDGEVAAKAGADFAMGSESRAAYGERSAPERASQQVQGSSLVAIAANLGRPVSFTPPPGTPPFKPRLWEGSVNCAIHHGHDGYCGVFRAGKAQMTFLYMTEVGGDRDTIRDDAAIYEDLLKGLWAEWDHIKNGPHAEDARNWDLLWVSPKAGKRESRRFLGDYVMTQTDLEAGRRFEDDIAYGGHNLDEHRMLPSGNAEIHGHGVPPLYGIPYRSCYSRNIANLLLAGRLVSATHLAHSSVRVMRTGAAQGQAVGMAAGLCRKHGCGPREVGAAHLRELQEALLRADAALLDRPLPPEGDLARTAAVSASAECRFNDATRPGEAVPLINRMGNLLHDWRPALEAVEFHVRNVSDRAQPLTLSVWRSVDPRPWRLTESWRKTDRTHFAAADFRRLASVETSIPDGFEGWHRVALSPALTVAARDGASDDDVLLIALEVNPYITWSVSATPCALLEMWEAHEERQEWRALKAVGAMRVWPPPALGEATNAVDGFARRFSTGPTHFWMSPAAAGLPQELILAWPAPQRVARVTLRFDNLARALEDNPWEYGPRVLPYLVKDYALDAWVDGGWRELLRVQDNIHRFGTHALPAVVTAKIRLRVLAAHGQGQGARVYEIEVYGP